MSQGKRTDLSARRSGYTSATWGMLDAAISGDAALLLMRLRRLADCEETDGLISERDIAGLAAFHNMQRRTVSRYLAELIGLGLLEKRANLYADVEFMTVCRSHSTRDFERERWKLNKKTARDKTPPSSKPPDVPSGHSGDFAEVSSGHPEMSPRTASASASASTSAAASPNGLPADSEGTMPTQADTILLAETWKDVSGKPVGISETSHIGWWLNTYDRLAASQIADTMQRIATRPGQEPIGRISYFDSILREQNDASKQPRGPGVIHEMERFSVPVIVRGVDAHGNPEPPEPLEIPA
jgi:hypothetical protein